MSDDDQLPSLRKPLDEVAGRALVEAWRSSGLSGAAFCRQHHLRAQRLNYWRERLGYPVRLVAVRKHPVTPSAPATEGFVQVVVGTTSPTPTSHVDIVVGDAVIRVRPGFDSALLREVVRAMTTNA
jgi:hypothetical protein